MKELKHPTDRKVKRQQKWQRNREKWAKDPDYQRKQELRAIKLKRIK
jgi:hypothetical protein